jgi:hypothetical protein
MLKVKLLKSFDYPHLSHKEKENLSEYTCVEILS